jgi:hypothetical protein
LAHGLPGLSDRRPGTRWTRHAIADAVRERGGADVSGVVAELVRDGALIEVAAGPADTAGFSRAHRFRALLLGLGAAEERPDQFHIGLTGRPLATVDELAFDFWQWAPLHDSVWEACQALAGVERASSGTAPTIEQMLDLLLERLHILLANGCGYLDVVPALPHSSTAA